MKLTVEQQKELIPDSEVRKCFMERLDIAQLPEMEREARWQRHLVKLREFQEFLSGLDGFVIHR